MRKVLILALSCHMLLFYTLPITAFAAPKQNILAPYVDTTSVGAKAAIVIEPMTGRVLFEQNAHEKLPIASTTKILSALIALEQPDIDAEFVVDDAAILVEGSSMGLVKGDIVSLRDLAYGMLLPSGNDAANAAAVRIAGSNADFTALMNERASSLGLKNSSFETPSGLDSENHYSTAYDMAFIAREALKNQDFADICSQYKARITYGNPPYERWLTNHNKLLNYYDGAYGVKTGFTKKAGRCLVSSAKRDGVELIVVTLNCGDDWNTHKFLYDKYFSLVQIEDLSNGIPELKMPIVGGTKPFTTAVKTDIAQIPIPTNGADVEYKITREAFVYAPVKKGQYLGTATIFIDGNPQFQISLVANEDIDTSFEYTENKNIFNILADLFNR